MKARSSERETPAEAEEAYAAALLAVIKRAHFREAHHESVLEKVSASLEVYRAALKLPVLSRGALQNVLDAAKRLGDRISELDAFTQLQLGVLMHFRPNPLYRIITQATRIKNGLSRAGGRARNEKLDSLFIGLTVQWMCEFGNLKGITRSGAACEMYRGPLLDFVQQILDTQSVSYKALGNESRRVQYGGRSALGKRLQGLIKKYEMGKRDP